jgi:hypothetical protein
MDIEDSRKMIYFKREGIQFPDKQYLFFEMEY